MCIVHYIYLIEIGFCSALQTKPHMADNKGDNETLLHNRSKLNNKVHEEPKLVIGDTGTLPRGQLIHDDAPKRLATQRNASPSMRPTVKGFHLEPYHRDIRTHPQAYRPLSLSLAFQTRYGKCRSQSATTTKVSHCLFLARNDQRDKTITTSMSPTEGTPAWSTFWGRRRSIHGLEPKMRPPSQCEADGMGEVGLHHRTRCSQGEGIHPPALEVVRPLYLHPRFCHFYVA
jgi:hypothetical protein